MRTVAMLLLAVPAWAARCDDMVKTVLPRGQVDSAQMLSTGTFAKMEGLPRFCRVAFTLRPSEDSDIKNELWLPEQNWNGRLEGTGNGGFAGHISYGSLAQGLKHGYAAVNTNMGMATPPGKDATVFVGRPERWKDWGYRATHEMTVAAKLLVTAYYPQPLRHSYFNGCSTGGQQALQEAERYPEDYDGIVGGAPAHNRTGVHMSILWNFAAGSIPVPKLAILSRAVTAKCGDKDGIVADPTKCDFDPGTLQCKGVDHGDCLSAAQVGSARKLYQGPQNSRTGKQIYPGLSKGSELAWTGFDVAQPPFAPIFRWVFGPDWDWHSFDFDKAEQQFENKLGGTLNATSSDLSAFRKRGGKLLLYHGWADWLVPPGETIRYYDTVRDGGKSVRLFMLPGVSHCIGGPGADSFDPLDVMARWVEEGRAPETIETVKVVNGTVAFRKTICDYPRVCPVE